MRKYIGRIVWKWIWANSNFRCPDIQEFTVDFVNLKFFRNKHSSLNQTISHLESRISAQAKRKKSRKRGRHVKR